MPMSARRSAGASLTPSPVIATTSPSAAQRVGDAQLGLGRVAREDDLAVLARGARSSSASVISSSSSPVTTRSASMPTRRATAARGEAVVAGDDDDADPGLVAARDRVGDLGTRRVEQATRPSEAEPGSASARVRQARRSSRRRATASTRSPSLAAATDVRPRRVARAASVERPLPCRRRRATVVQRASTASGAPLVCDPALAVDVVDRRHQLERRVEAEDRCCRAPRGVAPVTSAPRRCAAASSSAISVGSPAAPCVGVVDRRRRAARQGRSDRTPAAIARHGSDALVVRRGRRRPAVVQTATTRMRFSVSVPVLSVQITVVEPSVSTALSRLTSAPRRASDAHADAERERDRRQQALGHVADEQADREDGRGRERQARASVPSGRNARPMHDGDDRDDPRDPADLALERALARARRVATARRCGRARVCIPVANTTARASPPVQVVPLNTRSAASSRPAPPRRNRPERHTGTDSPVSVDVSTSTLPASRRASARDAIAFGDDEDVAGHDVGRVDRPLVTGPHDGRPRREVAAQQLDGSFRLLFLNERETAFTRSTITTATPTVDEPVATDNAAASHSSSASGWSSWRANRRTQERAAAARARSARSAAAAGRPRARRAPGVACAAGAAPRRSPHEDRRRERLPLAAPALPRARDRSSIGRALYGARPRTRTDRQVTQPSSFSNSLMSTMTGS